MSGIRVAIAGVGGCASSFTQFIAQASSAPNATGLPGLMYPHIGGYALDDVEIVVAFDVDSSKVGVSLREAIASPNVSATRHVDVGEAGRAPVLPTPVLDGVDGPLKSLISVHSDVHQTTPDDVAAALAEFAVDVLLITLPTGAAQATQMFVDAALSAGASVMNATPARVARDPDIAARFATAGLAVLGDDLRSHIGATTLHTALLELLQSRGLQIDSTMQLNVGGNTDFYNLASPQRSQAKFESKANALRAAGFEGTDTGAGPTGFVRHLGDRKVCFLTIDATSVLGSRLSIDLKLEVEDSPNAAGVIASGVRAAQFARDQGYVGAIQDASALLFKSPPLGLSEAQATAAFHRFLEERVPSS